MLIGVGELVLEVRPGVPAAQIVAFARSRGAEIPDRPWCGATLLEPQHPAGRSPLVDHARLTATRGPDARPRPGVHLAVVGGPDAGLVATLRDGLVVGRSPDAVLSLTDPCVSANHLRFASGRVELVNGRNGAVLRGRRIRLRPRVSAGDVLRLGDTTLVLCDPGAGPPPAPAKARPWGLASSAMAAVSMGAFALATGHLLLLAVALVLPAGAAAGYLLRRPRESVGPALDVTGTLALPELPTGPIAVQGPRELVRAVTLATGRPPPGTAHAEQWMDALPAADREVAWVEGGSGVPSWAEVSISARGKDVAIEGHGQAIVAPLPLVSAANADAAARRIAARLAGAALPDTVRWGELPNPGAHGMAVRLGIGTAGPVLLDLVADGPHLLVAGTTGSGKSEALRTIVGSLAHDFPPSAVTFALIDFKGGAGLRDLASLPHVGSVLTDLEPHLARRCLLALAAELVDRKRAAAAAGATGFDDWRSARPPRLVVVIDEFQEIASADRDFLPELARLAAQGRSLGIHLILATQRPAGSVGAQIRANIGATLALRTASESESRDVIGSAQASQIPPHLPGRAVLLRGAVLEDVQVALPLVDPPAPIRVANEREPQGATLAEAASGRHSGRASALWLPELPTRIAPAREARTLPDAAGRSTRFVLGIADAPRTRSREQACWDPDAGPLVISGPPRSGRSSALHAIGALANALGTSPIMVPADPRLAVRTLALALTTEGTLLLVDDCARTLAGASAADPDVADLLAEALIRVPTALVVPPTWATHRLTSHAAVRLVLSGLPEADEAAWALPSELRGRQALPGRCFIANADGWREAQLALPGDFSPKPLALPLPAVAQGPLPARAIGIGGDHALPLEISHALAAVVGPPGPERDSVARRLAAASGQEPLVTDSAFSLGLPGSAMPRTVVVLRATARSLRELTRDHPRGLLEAAPLAFRGVVSIDGVTSAVQLLPG